VTEVEPPLPPLPRPPLAWNERETDARAVDEIVAAAHVAPALARMLVGRGVTSAAAAATYLQPTLKQLPDPLRLAGIDAALERIEHSIKADEPIGVFGDYDVDGVTSTTLLTDFFENCGIRSHCTIPDRLIEGYGLSRAGVDRLADAGCKLLVTVDCGVTNHDEILYAKQRGIDVVVVDHHTVPVELPKATAVINPHRDDCTRGSEMLCAVGVTFNLAMALRRRLRDVGWFSSTRPEPDLRDALDLVALGTVADVVPLVGENRVLVHAGLKALRQGKRPGLQALLAVANVDAQRVAASDLGFQLGPRVNAAGRLGDAIQGVQLLRSAPAEAERLAAVLDAENKARRDLEKRIVADAIAQVDRSTALRTARAIVVGDDGWHPGVVGIVASRLVDRFGRPAIVVGEGGRGSGRSIEAFHLYDALRAVSLDVGTEVLAGFGGHAHAAGVRIAAGGFERFRDAMLSYAQNALVDDDLRRVAWHDGAITGNDLMFDAVQALSIASPFGRKNPEPLFVVENVRLRGVKVLKEEHLKGSIDPRSFTSIGQRSPGFLDVISFGSAARAAEWDGPVDLLATPEVREWNGQQSVQLRIRDFRRSTST
jgi:single-stranded-DNA-specific exonuclease